MAKKTYTVRDVEEMMLLAQGVISLNTPVGATELDEIPDEIIDIIPDDCPSPEEELIEKNRSTIIDRFINTLTEKEQRIIRLRFGFEDGRPRTLEEIGQELGLSRERVRQIEARAIRKLRGRLARSEIRREDL